MPPSELAGTAVVCQRAVSFVYGRCDAVALVIHWRGRWLRRHLPRVLRVRERVPALVLVRARALVRARVLARVWVRAMVRARLLAH